MTTTGLEHCSSSSFLGLALGGASPEMKPPAGVSVSLVLSLLKKELTTKGLAPVYYEGCYYVTPRIVRVYTHA